MWTAGTIVAGLYCRLRRKDSAEGYHSIIRILLEQGTDRG
jgi:hypothetical protein